jgi:YHS domain-containing protein
MYRLILVVLLLTVLYLLLRQMFRGFKTPIRDDREKSPQDQEEEQDQMIEDPVCHIFVPKRIALIETIGGREYCFCSQKCSAKFRTEHPV